MNCFETQSKSRTYAKEDRTSRWLFPKNFYLFLFEVKKSTLLKIIWSLKRYCMISPKKHHFVLLVQQKYFFKIHFDEKFRFWKNVPSLLAKEIPLCSTKFYAHCTPLLLFILVTRATADNDNLTTFKNAKMHHSQLHTFTGSRSFLFFQPVIQKHVITIKIDKSKFIHGVDEQICRKYKFYLVYLKNLSLHALNEV